MCQVEHILVGRWRILSTLAPSGRRLVSTLRPCRASLVSTALRAFQHVARLRQAACQLVSKEDVVRLNQASSTAG